jgi:hypothetical protein
MKALKAVSVAWLAMGIIACGSDQQPLEIRTANSTGTVGGLVLDAVTLDPLPNVDVTLLAGGVATPVQTDAAGAFSFTLVPTGTVGLTISHPSYLSAVVRSELVGAGEYPIDNATLSVGPIALVPSSGSFSALVMYDDGSPAGDIPLTARSQLRFYDLGGNLGMTNGAQLTTVSATTDASGLVTFTGLPDFVLLGDGANDLVSVVVPPIAGDSGGPAIYRYPGGTFNYHMTAVGSTTPLIVLDQDNANSLAVTASTIQSLEPGAVTNPVPSVVPAGGPIFVAFNQALSADYTTVQLLDETGKDQTALVQKSVAYNTLQLTFSPELSQSAEYNLLIHGVGSIGDKLVRGDFTAPFFTPPTPTVLKPAMTREVLDPLTYSEVIHLVFAEPIGTGVPGSNVFSGGNCVLFFTIALDGDDSEVGNDPGETTNPNCLGNIVLESEEPDPAGMAGLSGYTKYWKFNLPVLPGPAAIPTGTPINIVFSRVASGGMLMKRVTGETVPDFVGTMNLVLP